MSVSRAETKKVKALQTKKGRRLAGKYIAEGVRLLEEACRLKVRPLELYYSEALLSDRGLNLVREFEKLGVVPQTAHAADLDRMAGATTPQGILAVFEIPETDLTKLHRTNLRNILIGENLSDPGNVGTLIRTAAAFDIDLVVLCGRCAEPFAPKVVRSSVGAVFGLPVAVASTDDTLDFVTRHQIRLIAAGLKGRLQLTEVLSKVKNQAVALAIGSEANGLSEELLIKADHVVRIEHSRQVESLNSAVAGAILMKECYDSRGRRK
ncbi:MAG: RNA methyltransferase [candidate division Zixibacteria bacterium]|nr:RNA methyltransferase [candidate division Zixibacteria bacterium]